MGQSLHNGRIRLVLAGLVFFLGVLLAFAVGFRCGTKGGPGSVALIGSRNESASSMAADAYTDNARFLLVPDGEGGFIPRLSIRQGHFPDYPQDTMVLSLLSEENMVSELFWHDSSRGIARITYSPQGAGFEVAIAEGIPGKSRVIMRLGDGFIDYAVGDPPAEGNSSGPNLGMSRPTEVRYVIYNQSSEPDIRDGATAFWANHSDQWLIWDYGGTQKKVRFS